MSEKIAVLAPNWLGDAVMCTPALRILRHRFPDAVFTVAGRPAICALLRHTPWIDRLIELPTRGGLADTREGARRLRGAGTDAIVVFPHSFRAALLAWMAGGKRRVGQARNGRSWLLTDRVQPYREQGRVVPVYMAIEYLAVAAALGAKDDNQGLELHADPVCIRQMREALPPSDGPVIGLAAGAAFGFSKRWLPERFAQTADTLTERLGARCVLLTGPGEEETRDAVLAAAKRPIYLLDNGKPSLDTLKATVSLLDLMICNDSGPRHIAVAFGIPVICVMGSTSPRYTESPWEKGEVVRIDVDCGPCQKPVCTTDHRCMTGVTTERVVETALRYLVQRPSHMTETPEA